VVGVAEDDVAVTYPAAYDPIDDSDMLAPLANAPALAKALANSNAAWKEYVPSPLTVCYTDTALTTAARVFRMPITPSADAKVAPDDGMTYDIIHEVLTGTGTTAITITVEEQSAGGGWSGIYGPTATAAAATSWVQVTTNVVIAATTDELRFTYSRGTDPTTPMSATVIPAPEAPTVRQTSGFWPYDEAFTAIAGVPSIPRSSTARRATSSRCSTTADNACCRSAKSRRRRCTTSTARRRLRPSGRL
jgi:hypothetical protein